MNKKINYGKIPVIAHSKKKSAEEDPNRFGEPLLSRFHPPSPDAIVSNQNTRSSRKYISRFNDDIDLNERISPRIVAEDHPAKNDRLQSHPINEKKYHSRWPDDEASDQPKQEQQINEHPQKNKNIDLTTPICPLVLAVSEMSQAYVQEFHPTSARDPIFAILRDLFIFSFDDYYKQIETKLRLNSNKSLIQWLDGTFDDEQQSILSGKYRCFILYANLGHNLKENILGFLTLQEEEEPGSVYIAQVAIRRKYKRRGYGYQLLQHLRRIYPSDTFYWGLCRRANEPAIKFYLQLGATYMDTDDDAIKYGYDPILYAGFKFIDVPSVIAPPVSVSERFKRNTTNAVQQPVTSTNTAQNSPNPPSTNDTGQTKKPAKKNRRKVVGCCTQS